MIVVMLFVCVCVCVCPVWFLAGDTALLYACRNSHVRIVDRILGAVPNRREAQALVNHKNALGECALSIAVRLASVELVKLLLAAGANPNLVGASGGWGPALVRVATPRED